MVMLWSHDFKNWGGGQGECPSLKVKSYKNPIQNKLLRFGKAKP